MTVLGQHMVNLKCMFPERSEAEVFYSSRVAWACFPPLMIGACVMTWRGVDFIFSSHWYRTRVRCKRHTVDKDNDDARHRQRCQPYRSRIGHKNSSAAHAASKDICIRRSAFVSDLARHVLRDVCYIRMPECLRRRVALKASDRSYRVLF